MLEAEGTTARLHPRRRSRLHGLVALALGLGALGATATALADDAQIESGFALQATLGGRASLVTATNGGTTLPAGLSGQALDVGLLAGYKSGRLLIGIGIDFINTTLSPPSPAPSESISAFLIGPEVDFAFLRSPDNRVELLGDLALHFGHEFIPNPTNAPNQDSNFLLSYQIGPGVRFWAHKHFAIQALTGFSGELVHDIPPSGATGNGDSSVNGIFVSFGMLGVF
jgi:hypothetical protein